MVRKMSRGEAERQGLNISLTPVQAEIMMQLLYCRQDAARTLYTRFKMASPVHGDRPIPIKLRREQVVILEQVLESEIGQIFHSAWAQYRREGFSAEVQELFDWMEELQGIWRVFRIAEKSAQKPRLSKTK